jgi:hypothetical protein
MDFGAMAANLASAKLQTLPSDVAQSEDLASPLLKAYGDNGLGALNEKLDEIFLNNDTLGAFAQSLDLNAGEFDATQLRDCDRDKLKDLVRNEVIKCHGEKNPSSAKLTSRIANAFMGLYIYISAHFHSNKLFGVDKDASKVAQDCVLNHTQMCTVSNFGAIRAIDVPSGEDSMLWAFEAGSNPENLGTNGNARLIARDKTIPQYRGAISEGLREEAEALRQGSKGKEADELELRAKSGDFKPEDMRHLSKYLKKDIAIVVINANHIGGDISSVYLCTKEGDYKKASEVGGTRLNEALESGYAILIGGDGHCSGLKNDPEFAEQSSAGEVSGPDDDELTCDLRNDSDNPGEDSPVSDSEWSTF